MELYKVVPLPPSLYKKLEEKAREKKMANVTHLVMIILENWLEKEEEQ